MAASPSLTEPAPHCAREPTPQVVCAPGIELPVTSGAEHVNVDHRAISQAKDMGGDGRTRAEQLPSKYPHLFLRLGELHEEADDKGGISLRAVSEFLWQPAVHFCFLLSKFLLCPLRLYP